MGDKRTIAVVACTAALLLAGCSSAQAPADQEAADIAAKLGTRMSALRLFSATDLADTAASTPHVVLLGVTGKDARGTGVDLVIKVHLVTEDDWSTQREVTTDDCFELTYRNSVHDGTPSAVTCPNTPPVVLVPTVAPTLPQNIETLIGQALPVIPANGAVTDAMVAQARSAVNALRLDPGVHRDVTLERNVIGVAVRTPDQCEMGSAAPGGTRVWQVPAAEYQPGELICSAAEAAYGEGQTPPH